MPQAPPRPCRNAIRGCPRTTNDASGYCPPCRPEAKKQKQRAADTKTSDERAFYDSLHWRRIRAAHLKREPLCRTCMEEGRATPANTVDHIVPRRMGGSDRDDNLQSQCGTCHQRKRRTERG